MKKTIEFIILTKSKKNGGLCIAGVDRKNWEWVRIVSTKEGGAIFNPDPLVNYEILDILEICIEECPTDIQPENVLICDNNYKKLEGNEDFKEILEKISLKSNNHEILGNEYNYITHEKLKDRNLNHSLVLVKVSKLNLKKQKNEEGKDKIKAEFVYNNKKYNDFSVTDPTYTNPTSIDNAFLVISIGAPYNNKHYKFISKIFTV